MSRVKQQQAIYAPLMEYIADNRIHALSIKAYTPAQWSAIVNLVALISKPKRTDCKIRHTRILEWISF